MHIWGQTATPCTDGFTTTAIALRTLAQSRRAWGKHSVITSMILSRGMFFLRVCTQWGSNERWCTRCKKASYTHPLCGTMQNGECHCQTWIRHVAEWCRVYARRWCQLYPAFACMWNEHAPHATFSTGGMRSCLYRKHDWSDFQDDINKDSWSVEHMVDCDNHAMIACCMPWCKQVLSLENWQNASNIRSWVLRCTRLDNTCYIPLKRLGYSAQCSTVIMRIGSLYLDDEAYQVT